MNKSGFVGGTLVHTDKGLVPIEQLKVGDMVLSAPQNEIPSLDGVLVTSYKPITNIFESSENKPLFTPLGHPDVLCTANHPFWTKEKGWIRADDLNHQMNVYQLSPRDGSHYFHNMFDVLERDGDHILDGDAEYDQIFLSETPFKGIVVGFEQNNKINTSKERWYNGPYIQDFNTNRYIDSDGPYTIPGNLRVFPNSDELTEQEVLVYIEALEYVAGYQYYDPYKATVYNIEVADYHTYFVGEDGTWVHNCDPSTINNGFATLNNPEQWQHQGKINTEAAINSVTLVESSTAHTSLRQAFSISEDNRLLSFTIADSELNQATKQAGDAFEAALLNAKMGEAVTKITDITRTDSLYQSQ